ncbi:MAG: right-handed parallel beta-helix repeat-containing protein [Muribaculaceae bacterium]|nr:right-handed parallel beta-helix repeat-containing protein [Muribaculaceae bacterium]
MIKKLFALTLAVGGLQTISAQTYGYLSEGFENQLFSKSAATVSAPSGLWTMNKNTNTNAQAYDGSYSLLISQKAGIILPELSEGAGSLIYYALDNNREVTVQVSTDKVSWETVEAYKETSSWTKHTVAINRPDVRWLKISTSSNNNFYLDDILVTKPDGTDANGNLVVCNLDLPYFTNDFEHSFYPQQREDASSEKSFNVNGEGEWLYLNAYKGTNASYIADGSARALRMLKNSSYVVTPVLSQGVVKLTFDEGRTGKKLKIYTSDDAGANWNFLREIQSDTKNSIIINEKNVNRLKIANESSSDADIDNITVMAFPEGIPATISTGQPIEIGNSKATVAGEILDEGSSQVKHYGICWAVGEEPSVSSNYVEASSPKFNVTLSGLPADTEISYRAYALSLAGVGYGEVKKFSTLPPALPLIETVSIVPDDYSDEQSIYLIVKGKLIDNGGTDIIESGVCYSTESLPTIDSNKIKGVLKDDSFSAIIALQPSTHYFVRTYAINSVGISYGNEMEITTDEISVPAYDHNVYYCDPSGDDITADGSESKPFYSLQKAADLVKAGDIIYMKAGIYEYQDRININAIGAPNSGMIRLEALGGRAVLDFKDQKILDANQGIRLTGSYWHIYGLDIMNAGDNGLLIERNKPSGGSYADVAANVDEAHDNVIENCTFVRCADTGLQMKNLASYNRVINCDAYYNCDPDHGDADGFAVKISHGTGNYFYGCRAWQNSDDGWDQFIKKDGGFPDDITTTLEHCWAFENGFLEDGSRSSGNGNGFKLGSDQGRNNVILNRCMTFDNLNKGFDQNHNTGHMILNNCSGFSSKDTSGKSRYSYRLDEPVAADHEIRLTNCVAISDGIADRNKSAYAPHSVTGILITSDLNTLPSDYVTINPEGMKGPRNEDGSLPDIDFMNILPGNTKLIDAGSEVIPFDGQNRYSTGIQYTGTAPDLGYRETDNQLGVHQVTISSNSSSALHAVATRNGSVILTVDGATATDSFSFVLTDINGRIIESGRFIGHTVTITPEAQPGTFLIVRVAGDNTDCAVKIKM